MVETGSTLEYSVEGVDGPVSMTFDNISEDSFSISVRSANDTEQYSLSNDTLRFDERVSGTHAASLVPLSPLFKTGNISTTRVNELMVQGENLTAVANAVFATFSRSEKFTYDGYEAFNVTFKIANREPEKYTLQAKRPYILLHSDNDGEEIELEEVR